MFKLKFQQMSKVLSLRSSVLSEFFYMLMTNHNIKSIRNGMKVLIFYCYCEIVSSHMSERGVLFRPVVALVAFCIYFTFFAITVNVNNTTIMVRLSSIMVILSMTYTVVLGTDPREVMETHYSLSIVIILMMYTLFRLKFMITMLLSVVYILIFVSIGNYRMKYTDNINITDSENRDLESVRRFQTHIRDKRFFIFGQCILFFVVYLTGLYLRFFNSVRRKSAFLKLAQNAEAKMKINTAVQVQNYWIDAIMPLAVRDEFLKQSRNKDMFDLVYCKRFENVSILFADIVGFTSMSSNKTAEKLVYLLNDLYNRFDAHGKITNCEKIGTLGDCYYCVSGCPVARFDHALCCIEMGLRICEVIQDFNKDHKETVNMRVGVHSGRVTAAIIGNQRFRFDVFSNDVIIANSLESSGRPGLVHISEDTYRLVRHAYTFFDGDLLEIKREEEHGIGGFVEKIIPIRTFFVKPESKPSTSVTSIQQDLSALKRQPLIYRMKKNKQTNTSNHRLSMSADARKLFVIPNSGQNIYKLKDEKIKEDLNIVELLQRDPDKPVQYFHYPPINSFFLTFNDREIEHHYLYHTTDQVDKLFIDSVKAALLFDSIASLFFTTFILVAAYMMFPPNFRFQYYSPIVYGSGLLLVIIAAFISLVYKSELKNSVIYLFYSFFSHPISRLFLSISISSLPNILVLSVYNSDALHSNYQYTSTYFTITLFALIANSLSSSSYSLIKQISTACYTITGICLLSYPFKSPITEGHLIDKCSSYLLNQMDVFKSRFKYQYSFQLVHICLLIYYLTRENEKNIRINFFVSREAEIRNAEALRAKKIAESLLYNIIPKHVFAQIIGNQWNEQNDMTFSYAHVIPNAGVVFASISNFFSKYYREDYKDGEGALKLLHTIICTFDNLLLKPAYKSLEKIKTINDCYMIASGLNIDNEDENNDEHLIALMNYALDIHYSLHLFNDKNIIGFSGFSLKIGYNFGPVTAGIIGISKPLYDIWGDTVNVASRMYSTVPAGNIQVPDYVVDKLKHKFKFKYRGPVPIKGKGDMLTYLVLKSYKKLHLFIRSSNIASNKPESQSVKDTSF